MIVVPRVRNLESRQAKVKCVHRHLILGVASWYLRLGIMCTAVITVNLFSTGVGEIIFPSVRGGGDEGEWERERPYPIEVCMYMYHDVGVVGGGF